MDWHRKERYRSRDQETAEAGSLEIPDVESEDKRSVESTEAAAWLSAEMYERKERQAEKDAENIVRIREELEALSETEDKGVDVFGAERTVSGIESVDEEGIIRLISFNEGLTQYFTLRSREEMKMRGPKALGAYVREDGIVGDIVKILDGAGMDRNKIMAEAFVAGNA